MRVGVVRSRGRFRVVLHGENRKCFVPKAFHGSVVEIEVSDLEIGCAGDSFGAPLHRKTVVLRGDQHPSSGQFLDRMISATMAVGKLYGAASEGQAEELIPEADAESGESRTCQLANVLDGITERGRITRAIGEEETIGLESADFRGSGVGRNDGDPASG